jgi:rod shape-determining protein MreD
MSIVDVGKVAVLVLVATVLQTSVFADVSVLGGTPDVLLVTLVSIALLRGALVGAITGFAAGLLVDVALLGTLGETSLLLTVVGFWAGRYGETTARDRRAAPFLAVLAATLVYLVGALVLRFILAEPAPVQTVLIGTLVQVLALNLLLTWPVYRLVQRILPSREGSTGLAKGVGVLG